MPVFAPVSPWTYQGADSSGRVLSVTASFGAASPWTLTQVQIARAAGCQFSNILFGTGPDGTPDTATRKAAHPGAGTVLIPAATLAAWGFNTITDIWAMQVTAGL